MSSFRSSTSAASKGWPDGYPSLSDFIASDPDGTSLIYKRFNRLSSRTLLYLQSELAELQDRLDAFDEKDRGSLRARDWACFKEQCKTDKERIEVLRQIKDTILEYKTLLAHESALASLPPPDKRTLKAFRYYFFHGRPGDVDSFPMLGGSSAALYDDEDDLLLLRKPEQKDTLSVLAQSHLGFLFPERNDVGHLGTTRIRYSSGRRISYFVSWLSTLLAAILLIGAIVLLYHVHSPDVKLGLISAFTIIFAASVGLLTNARRAEIYGATAAYAAVLVVFVSGDLGSGR